MLKYKVTKCKRPEPNVQPLIIQNMQLIIGGDPSLHEMA